MACDRHGNRSGHRAPRVPGSARARPATGDCAHLAQFHGRDRPDSSARTRCRCAGRTCRVRRRLRPVPERTRARDGSNYRRSGSPVSDAPDGRRTGYRGSDSKPCRPAWCQVDPPQPSARLFPQPKCSAHRGRSGLDRARSHGERCRRGRHRQRHRWDASRPALWPKGHPEREGWARSVRGRPDQNTLNPFCVAPWVICVAAGLKDGQTLADFSSRGIPGDPLYHPTITAPGADIVAARATTGIVIDTFFAVDLINLGTDAVSYAAASGTSMATPHVSGTVALMLEANPALTPDQIKSTLEGSATPMPGYEEYQVGAGYLNAFQAVTVALMLAWNKDGLAVPKTAMLHPMARNALGI